MFPGVTAGTEYSHSMIFHDSKLPRPESYPSTSTSLTRSTIPAVGDHGVVALSICTFEINHGAPVRYLVFFLREALARIFQQGPILQEGVEGPFIDWADWGPDVSRWFIAPSFEQWRCSVHGYRFITLVTRLEAFVDISTWFPSVDFSIDDDLDSPLHVLVFDFNPYPLRRQSPPVTNNSVVIDPFDVTFYDQESRFEGHIVGRLACRITLMEEPADYAALAACEDNIIGIQVRWLQRENAELLIHDRRFLGKMIQAALHIFEY